MGAAGLDTPFAETAAGRAPPDFRAYKSASIFCTP